MIILRFESKQDLKNYIVLNMPLGIKPVGRSKYVFISPFTSVNAREICIDTIVDSLIALHKLNEFKYEFNFIVDLTLETIIGLQERIQLLKTIDLKNYEIIEKEAKKLIDSEINKSNDKINFITAQYDK